MTTRRGITLGIGLLALVALVGFIAANFQEVEIDFLVTDASMQLAFALIASALLGFLVGFLTSTFRPR